MIRDSVSFRAMLLPRFWRARQLAEKAMSKVAHRQVHWQQRRDRLRETSVALREVRHAARGAAIAILLIAMIQITAYLVNLRLSHSSPSWKDFIVEATLWLAAPLKLSGYDQLIATTVSMATTLLALYFATLGIIASASYTTAMPTLRAYVVEMPEGRLYVTSTLIAAVTGIAVLALPALGWSSSRALLICAIVVGVFALLTFARLGVRLFDFIEPARIIPSVAASCRRWQGPLKGRQRKARIAGGFAAIATSSIAHSA